MAGYNGPMTTALEPVLTITERARAKILEIRDQDPGEEMYALRIEVTGVAGDCFTYELAFEPLADAGPDDLVQHDDYLPVVISERSSRDLRGATLDLSRDLLNPGLMLDNPNTPSPAIFHPEAPPADLSAPLAQGVAQLLDEQINPAIAMHGGRADLIGAEEDTVYLRLSGGCQGCGMAQVTLRQGIEAAIRHSFPQVVRIVDVTDHAAGTDPYYQPSGK